MHPDMAYLERSVYTFWDFIGDIGGLFEIMKIIGSLLISFATFVTGSNLDYFLIKELFKFDKKQKVGKMEDVLTSFKRKKRAKLN